MGINMLKRTSIIFLFLSLCIIVFTPGYFRNDYVKLLDIITLVILGINLFVSFKLNQNINVVNSIFIFLYSIATLSSSVENENLINRVCNIFSIRQYEWLTSEKMETVWILFFLGTFLSGIIMIFYYSKYLLKGKLKPKK
jgi:hypothetical protein